MKNSRRTVQRLSHRRQIAQRRPLLVEQLEARNLLCIAIPTLWDSPPESYRSDNVSDDLARVAYQFDQWFSIPAQRDFVPSDCNVVVRDSQVLVQAIAVDSGPNLVSELATIDAQVIGNYELGVSTWVPLSRLKELKGLPELKFAGIALGNGAIHQAGAQFRGGELQLPLPIDAAENVPESALESSGILDVQANLDDYSDVPARFRSSRVSDLLARAAFEFSQRPVTTVVSDFVSRDPWVTVKDGLALIQAVSTTVSGDKLGEALTAIGAKVLGAFGPGVSAWFPLERIPALGDLANLTFASPVLDFAISAAGSVVTQGDGVMHMDQVRSIFGLDGTGQKIGVISDSYNRLSGAGYDISQGDLPSDVQVVSELPQGTWPPTDEGRAMLQIAYDVAPNANLSFATAYGGKFGFASAITSLRNNGATVIVDDLLYLDEPMFMDGSVAQAADAAVASGIPYVSAAGNFARNSYETAAFVNSGITREYGRGQVPMLDFDPGGGVDWRQQITIPANASLHIVLQWQDPFASDAPASGGATHDLDLLLLNAADDTVLAVSALDNPSVTHDPVELLSYTNGSTARVANVAIAGVNVGGLGRLK